MGQGSRGVSPRLRGGFHYSGADFERGLGRVAVSSGARGRAIVVLIGLLASSLAGCGRRGGLEPPPDPSAVAAKPNDQSPAAGLRRAKNVPIKPPHEPFILDPLL